MRVSKFVIIPREDREAKIKYKVKYLNILQ